MTTCPTINMDACTGWYTVGVIQNRDSFVSASGLWSLKALVTFVQSGLDGFSLRCSS